MDRLINLVMADFRTTINTYEGDFNIDTGLDHKTNIDTFIQYVQARILFEWMQQQNGLMNQLIDEVKKLDT